ncbi:ATPase P [uncultured Mailhella sp.]|uniref:ATPase P n=1 Tax=uncultured Mailhella sp. TaxID=1981031 RepID=UPI002606F8B6|nr:ATPase P [uncultured Mailhella sp.]
MRDALTLDIPGRGRLRLDVLVLDYNGTIAGGGVLLPGVSERLRRLARKMEIHVLTADTFGTVRSALEQEWGTDGLVVDILPPREARPYRDEGQAKLSVVERLGRQRCCAIGNGRNDTLMLEAAALSFGVLGREGAWFAALARADIVVTDVLDALDLLLDPRGIVATLRN